jgi:hypothetical protein
MRAILPFVLFFVAGFVILVIGRFLIMRMVGDSRKKEKKPSDDDDA